MRKTLTIVAVLAAVAITTVGVALALDDDDDTLPAGRAAERIAERLQPLVEDRTITADQAEKVAEHLASEPPLRRGFEARPGFHGGIDEIAEFLGMEPEELLDALRAGESLDDLLADAGKTAADLADVLVADIEEHLSDLVADGRMTEEEKAEALERAREHITEMIEEGMPFGGGFMPHRPGGFPFGSGDFGPRGGHHGGFGPHGGPHGGFGFDEAPGNDA
jgi:hypothetical protein